jgi:hypothetical protein
LIDDMLDDVVQISRAGTGDVLFRCGIQEGSAETPKYVLQHAF